MIVKMSSFHCDGDRALTQAAQRGYRAFILGDTQNPSGHGPEQPAPGCLD